LRKGLGATAPFLLTAVLQCQNYYLHTEIDKGEAYEYLVDNFPLAISVTATYVLGYTMGWTKAVVATTGRIKKVLGEQPMIHFLQRYVPTSGSTHWIRKRLPSCSIKGTYQTITRIVTNNS
jgi:hypothetical protein